MENIEKLISSAIEPLLARIGSLEAANNKLQREVVELRRHARPAAFSSSPKHTGTVSGNSDRSKEGKSKTLHTDGAVGSAESGSNFRPATTQKATRNVGPQEQAKPRTLTNTKSAATLKTLYSPKQPQNTAVHPRKTTAPASAKENAKEHPKKHSKDSKQTAKTSKEATKSTEGVAPEVKADPVVEVAIPEQEAAKESEHSARSKKVGFAEPTSFKYIDDSPGDKCFSGASEIEMLGLVSKQSLEPSSLVQHHFGTGPELSVQPEVASYLEQSYLKVVEAVVNAAPE